MKASLQRYPEIADAYELYRFCRLTDLFEYEFEKNKKPYRILLMHTKGLGVLPYEGGVMDQPERLMTYFEAFLAGDDHAFHVRLNKKA